MYAATLCWFASLAAPLVLAGCVEIPTGPSGGLQPISCKLAYSLPYFGSETYYYQQACIWEDQPGSGSVSLDHPHRTLPDLRCIATRSSHDSNPLQKWSLRQSRGGSNKKIGNRVRRVARARRSGVCSLANDGAKALRIVATLLSNSFHRQMAIYGDPLPEKLWSDYRLQYDRKSPY
jgi:hypothetical protein